MNDDDIKLLLRQSTGSADQTADCPDEDLFSSYIEGGLSEQDHQLLSIHLADCGYCLVRLGILSHAREAHIDGGVPELVMARAGKLVSTDQAVRPRWQQAPRWAAAALVVLAVGLLMRPDSASLPGETMDEPIRQTRNIKASSPGPVLLSPREGMSLSAVGGEFSWTPVQDSLYYNLRIVSDDGDLLWRERIIGTRWTPPTELLLEAGTEYFVRVDAYLTESKSINSDYVLFRVRGSR